jgi:hypothetical protein
MLFTDVDQLQWCGPTSIFEELTVKMGEPRLLTRANTLAGKSDIRG